MYIFLLLLIIPIIEIAIFIQVGGQIGLWPTLGLVVVTAVAGSIMLRHQGLTTLRRAQDALNRDELPVRQVFDGFCLAIGGALLLTPGFLTDLIGLALFIPQVRDLLQIYTLRTLQRRGQTRVFVNGVEMDPSDDDRSGPSGNPAGRADRSESNRSRGARADSRRQPDVIEGDFQRVDDDEPPSRDTDPPAR